MPVELLPSSRGAMLLRCESLADRDIIRAHSPISVEGHSISLQRPDECNNRFFRTPDFLAFVMVDDYPNSQWTEEEIKANLAPFCKVVEVDPACLDDKNFGPLRLLLEIFDHRDIPSEVWIYEPRARGRAGSVARISPVNVWPRANQLHDDDTLTHLLWASPTSPCWAELGA